jgi:ankyrin repeat protein
MSPVADDLSWCLEEEILQVLQFEERDPESLYKDKAFFQRCESLLESGARLPRLRLQDKEHLLNGAVEQGQPIMVKALIDSGISVGPGSDMQDVFLRQRACFNENVFSVLIAAGADIDHQNQDKNSLLQWACESGEQQTVECLLKAGARWDQKNVFGHSPLSRAASRGWTSIALLLVEAGAQVKESTSNGLNAAFFAALTGHTETCIALIRAGCDPHATTDKRNLWDVARSHGHTRTAEELEAFVSSLKALETIEALSSSISPPETSRRPS